MIHDIFQIILWATVIMLAISGIDDLYLDGLYWFVRRRYKSSLPDFSQMHDKPEKPIAILMGAWNESGVIGRTLSYALSNLKYKDFRFFIGVYPNDLKTIQVVRDMALKDSRVKVCINPTEGPTTKADNLNSIYAAICEFEKQFGEFEMIIVHDAEDFIHPYSLKLYNYLIGYKGYHGIQIPVVPIKSKHGKMFHRTSCDAFAEIHTKDMIVRQSMGTFIPFSGTGMGFHRKALYHLDKFYNVDNNLESKDSKDYEYFDPFGKKVEMSEVYFNNVEIENNTLLKHNTTKYHEDPFNGLNINKANYKISNNILVKRFTFAFMIMLMSGVSYLFYIGNIEIGGPNMSKIYGGMIIQSAFGLDKKVTDSPDQRLTIIDNKDDFYTGLLDLRYNSSAIRLTKEKFLLQNRNHRPKDEINSQQNLLNNHLIIGELSNSSKATNYIEDPNTKY
jgi:hypothetical protein